MASNNGVHVYRYPENGEGGGGNGAGGGDGGGNNGGNQGGSLMNGGGNNQGGGNNGGAKGPFSDAASARTFLTEYVNDPEVLKAIPDEKVVGWAGHVKTKVDSFGKQFPADWRQQVAGDNAEHLKTLERFQSPKALYDSYAAIRAKMSSGELKAQTPFPDKGTPEQQSAWRKDMGLPEKADGYEIKLPDGVVLGEQDKAGIEAFKAYAHSVHMRPEHLNAAIAYDFQRKGEAAEARSTADAEFRAAAEDKLRAEWQQDFRGNIARMGALLDSAPRGVKDKIANARAADGTALGDDPDIIRWMVDMHRQVNPAGVVIPGAGGNLATSIADEIAGIEKFMREDRQAYNKDEKKQARLRELYGARDQMDKKKAA